VLNPVLKLRDDHGLQSEEGWSKFADHQDFGQLQELDLSNKGINDFPKAILLLTQLTKLALNTNAGLKSLPVDRLVQLTKLSCEGCSSLAGVLSSPAITP
jgi:Leucine-rich repeat (LRR) protein